MTDFASVAVLIGVLGTAVVFGTDVFCAMVQRPVLALIEDAALIGQGDVDEQVQVAGTGTGRCRRAPPSVDSYRCSGLSKSDRHPASHLLR
jgi:hypothetical protein